MHHDDASHDDGKVHAHIGSMQLYLGVFAALIALTIVTVGFSYIHLGALNLLVAVVVATMKAALVALYFMHLKDDHKFNAMVFIGSLLFAGVFLAYTLNDTEHRQRVDMDAGAMFLPATGERAPGGSSTAAPRSTERYVPPSARPAKAVPSASGGH